MILIAIGANLPSRRWGPPRTTCEAALRALQEAEVGVLRCSRWYRSNPAPGSGGPAYVNGVALVETTLEPTELLALLHRIEAEFERVRTDPGAPRTLDLDLLAFSDAITGPGEIPALPHPRMHERAFVLLPLAEVAPEWRHPVSGLGVRGMIEALPRGQVAEPLEDGDG